MTTQGTLKRKFTQYGLVFINSINTIIVTRILHARIVAIIPHYNNISIHMYLCRTVCRTKSTLDRLYLDTLAQGTAGV